MTTDQKLLTIEAFHEFVQQPENEGQRWELVKGVPVEMLLTTVRGSITGGRIIRYFGDFDELGYTTGANGGYQLSHNTIRMPNVAFISKGRVESLAGVTFSVAPDLAVEVISPSETPSAIRNKIDEYLTAGTQQVWTVYPKDKVIDVWQLADDGSKNVRTVDVNGILNGGDILPGFTLEAKRVFPE